MKRLDLALLVYDVDATGGMERQARLLAQRLADRGARVRIVTCFWVDGLVPTWRPVERVRRLAIHRLGLPRGWGYLAGLSFFEVATLALLAVRPPDVLYAVQWTGGVHALRVARVLERGVAVKLACGGVHGDMKTIRESEDRAALATLQRADRIVCLTEQIEQEARASGFEARQLARIPNGIELAVFERASPAAFEGTLEGLADAERVLFVGALRAQKHLPSLLEAFSLLRDRRPRAHLLVAGEGEERAALEALARAKGLEDRVRFLGRRADVPALLKAAHVFVLPSESEGLSNALLEALAASTPVVATDIEGNRAVVEGGREALLFPLDDARALADAIERILASPELARSLATAGLAKARTYDLDAVAASYERELRALARPRPAASRILGRWVTALEGPGVTGLARRGVVHAFRRGGQLLLERLDATTIAAKRALGLPVPAPSPRTKAATPQAPSSTSPAQGSPPRGPRRRAFPRRDVLFLVHMIDRTGGMERQALRLAEALAARGRRVTVVSSAYAEGWLPLLPRGTRLRERRGRLTILRVPLCRPWRWTWCESLYELVAAWVGVARASTLGAIYAVQWETGLAAAPVARLLGAPLVVKFAGGGANGDFVALARSEKRRRALAALGEAAGLVCLSPQIEAEAVAAGLPRERVLRIPNGVDLARLTSDRLSADRAPAQLPSGPEGEAVLFVGALRREKRLPDLVRAFARVARERPRAHLVLAGDGPEEGAIRAAISAAGLEGRAHLLGKRTDVPALLRAARVFVLTTESEGLSNALLEAMAAGTPIVATDVEGNRAVVESEREALLVPLEDEAALARALSRLLEDRALAERLSRAARAKVERYDLPRVAREYDRALARLARPLPSSGRLALGYLARFENPGLTGLGASLGRYAFGEAVFHVKRAISAAVVAAKGALGIEGALRREGRP